MGMHLLPTVPAQPTTSEQHNCSAETVRLPQQGKQKQLKVSTVQPGVLPRRESKSKCSPLSCPPPGTPLGTSMLKPNRRDRETYF